MGCLLSSSFKVLQKRLKNTLPKCVSCPDALLQALVDPATKGIAPLIAKVIVKVRLTPLDPIANTGVDVVVHKPI